MTTTRETITLTLGAGSTMTVTAHRTAAPGLVVHDYSLFGDQWRLTHKQSGAALGEFDEYQQAQAAAAALKDVADWTAGPEALQAEDVIWKAIDAIEHHDGMFLSRKGGLGERVAAKRAACLAAKEDTTT